jgi:hypothetical protein
MCEFIFRMFYAYKNGDSTVYRNDGNQHKRGFEKCGNNVDVGICEKIKSNLSAVRKPMKSLL